MSMRAVPSFRSLVFFVFLSVIISVSSFSSFASFTAVAGDWLCYTVTSSSSTLNSFYGAWPPGQYFGNWSVNIGDLVYFNITSVSSDSINGTLQLGSYIFSNIRNIDIASALVLSVYPWYGGFLTNTSQLLSNKDSFLSLNTTIYTINTYYQEINGQNLSIPIVVVSVSNYYGQNSLFYYSFGTGILLNATTSFGNYSLGLILKRTNMIVIPSTSSERLNLIISSVSFALLVLTLSTKKLKL